MKHISHFLPSLAEIARNRERALLREEARRRRYLTDMIAIRFTDGTFAAIDHV